MINENEIGQAARDFIDNDLEKRCNLSWATRDTAREGFIAGVKYAIKEIELNINKLNLESNHK